MANDSPFLFDVSRLIWRRWVGLQPTGIDRVCLAYLKHFAPLAQAVVHHQRFRVILDRRASAALFDLVSRPSHGFRRQLVADFFRFFRGSVPEGGGRPYLNIGHTGLNSQAFVRWVQRANVRPFYFVHDLIPITHPQFCRIGEAARHNFRIRTVLRTASGIIANSQATLDSLEAFARSEGLLCPPSIAAWLGANGPKPQVAPTERPIFVIVGTIEARKNHRLLLDIWPKLVERCGSTAPKLLILGQRGWEAQDVFAILDSNKSVSDMVLELNHCTDSEIRAHMATARALLFPSRIEGFGLPLIEALHLGVPVIASDLPVFREIGQGVPTFIDAMDKAAWEAAILDFAREDSAERAAQLERMQRFRSPSWDAHFCKVEAWLEGLSR